MNLKIAYSLCLLCFSICFSYGLAQPSTDQDESSVLGLIKSASDAIHDGDYKRSANFLSLAKATIDSSSSDLVLYRYYQNFGTLAFDKYQLSEALDAFTRSAKYAVKLKDTGAIIVANSAMGSVLLADRRFREAVIYHAKALDLASAKKDSRYYGILANMAIGYTQANEYDKALNAYREVKEYFQDKKELQSQAIVENNIGELYRDHFKDYEKAKEHYNRAVSLNIKVNDKNHLSKNYHNLSLLFLDTKLLDSAYFYINKAIDLKKEIGDTGGLAIANYALGSIQLEAGNYRDAIISFSSSLEISKEYRITPGLFYANIGLGKANLELSRKQVALGYYNNALENARLLESFDMQKEILKALFEFHKEERNFERALLYNEELQALEDSLAIQENSENLNSLRVQYETDLAETENKILKEREAVREQQLEFQNIAIMFMVIVLVIVLISVFFLYRAYKQRKFAYQQLKKTSKELESQYEKIKKQEAELKNSVALKDRIFSVLGHDLRTPLANIISLIDSISQIELTPEEMETILKHLKGETVASLKSLENILQWARLQMDDKSINVIDLDEDEIIIDVISNYESNAEAKDIQVNYVNKSMSVFWADENQFRSIAGNLIANAIKFSPVKGTVEVQFLEKKDHFIFTVSDEGKGIDDKVIENLETQQELMSSYGTEGEKGTGIGLRIVKDFVEIHQGEILFSSKEPTGTIVTVHFPKLVKTED